MKHIRDAFNRTEAALRVIAKSDPAKFKAVLARHPLHRDHLRAVINKDQGE